MTPTEAPPRRTVAPLSPAEIALLRVVYESDRDHGGLAGHELVDDELEACGVLVDRGLVEAVSEYGEAPDGEEDERDAGGAYVYRVTGLGVEALREARERLAGDGA